MVKRGRGRVLPPEWRQPDDMTQAGQSRGTGVIFALVAIALILAIAFFYLTRESEVKESRAITEAAESDDSAARLVGDAAHEAVRDVRRQN
ncbi:hypothetical protein BV98_000349 [Sphingobium herbicidovorans NBRC 16415]|uniref:Uncharacterized protein n=1 Tax=Sphingobium herbicidovorans (strain ATCC 700291 / DSM 11019 / CCUG 56400 / KCTC 2939 / LMG 18315 / NBRC 16415 / MH) TaxID=1219045 RepID=A0A086PFC9_SPHHM|nr:hypothetical protein [Sphingobium herbicidovorans]KFG92097.1 hypothetical protein BV98_000349 [Sphingobium herbicidovorans NBRC 16415]